MKVKICVDESLAQTLMAFFAEQKMDVELLTGQTQAPCDLIVVPCHDRRESDLNTIYSKGWIACPTALALARKLGIPSRQLGLLLNHLEIKVRNCGLGCFK